MNGTTKPSYPAAIFACGKGAHLQRFEHLCSNYGVQASLGGEKIGETGKPLESYETRTKGSRLIKNFQKCQHIRVSLSAWKLEGGWGCVEDSDFC